MGVYVRLTNALVTRLTAAALPGGKLEGVQSILAGPRVLIEKLEDVPSIVLEITSITENYGVSASKVYLSADIEVSLWVKYGMADQTPDNLYFNTGEQTGMLYLIEKIGDAINETSGFSIDPRLGAQSRSPVRLEFTDFELMGDKYIFQLKLKMTTINFLINGRSS